MIVPLIGTFFVLLIHEEPNTQGVSDIPRPIVSSVPTAIVAKKKDTQPDCKNFGAHIVKIAPANTSRWSEILRDSQYCLDKTNDQYFKDLVERYSKKVSESNERIAREKALIAKIGPKPVSAASKSFIKKIARDPASVRDVKCSGAVPSKKKDSWLQTCNFRGKNAFGGYVVNQITVKIRENVVIGVVE